MSSLSLSSVAWIDSTFLPSSSVTDDSVLLSSFSSVNDADSVLLLSSFYSVEILFSSSFYLSSSTFDNLSCEFSPVAFARSAVKQEL